MFRSKLTLCFRVHFLGNVLKVDIYYARVVRMRLFTVLKCFVMRYELLVFLCGCCIYSGGDFVSFLSACEVSGLVLKYKMFLIPETMQVSGNIQFIGVHLTIELQIC